MRVRIAALALLVLALVVVPVAPAAAQDEVEDLPLIRTFTGARFELLTTLQSGGTTRVAYGGGSLIMPDRLSLWQYDETAGQLLNLVQVDSAFYLNSGAGWQQVDTPPFAASQNPAIGAQLDRLEELARTILEIGQERVRNVPTTHYQVWLTGEDLLKLDGAFYDSLGVAAREEIARAIYKIDLWIAQDGRLYQQSTTAITPANSAGNTGSVSTTLVSYADYDDPTISIGAPMSDQ